MGRKPEQAATTTDKDGCLQVRAKDMLAAMENLIEAVEEGNIEATDYSFIFATAEIHKRAGGLDRKMKRRQFYWEELTDEMLTVVSETFDAVENGYLTEKGYYFELTTPYFQFTSGNYPPQDKDGKELVLWMHLNIYGQQFYLSIGFTIRVWHVWLATFALIMLTSPAGTLAMTDHEQPLTLTAGKNGIVPFECSNQQQFAPKYTTVKFEEKERPFYIDGLLDPEGLMSPDQAERFTVEYYEDSSSMSIEISIASVSIEDQGTYIVMVIIHGATEEHHLMKKAVIILIPPGPAECFLMRSERMPNYYEMHCHFKPGNVTSTLACFQNGEKTPYVNDGNTNLVVNRRTFWITDLDIPISCCSHDIKDTLSITQDSCNQYKYPRIESFTSPAPPANNIETEMHIYRPTKPFLGLLPIEEGNGQYTTKGASHSGSTQNFVWSSLLLPAIIITYACTMNP